MRSLLRLLLREIKRKTNKGSRINQNFVYIPIEKLKNLIKYRAKLFGIRVYIVHESYTSLCSSLDLEPLKKHKKYIGERFGKRGRLFKGSNYIINADVNGALNILRKVIGDDFIRSSVDIGNWFSPLRIRDLIQTSYKQFHLHCVYNNCKEYDN